MTSPQRIAANADDQDEFIDLSQIGAFALRNWKVLLVCVLLTMACGAALFTVLPSRWQAETTIEIGQMPAGGAISLIESPAQSVERVKQRELINIALNNLKIPIDQEDHAEAKLFRRTLKPAVVKNTHFIEISVAGYSPEQARNSLVAGSRTLIDAHNKLMAPMVAHIVARIKDNDKQMADAQLELAKLKATMNDINQSRIKVEFAPHIVAVTELANKETQINRIKLERVALDDLLNPSRTYPTRIISAIYVEPRPYFPKLWLFLAAAALAGLVIGLAVAWYRERRRVARHLAT